MKAQIKDQSSEFKPVTIELTFESQNEIEGLFFLVNHHGLDQAVKEALGEFDSTNLRDQLEGIVKFDLKAWTDFCSKVENL